MSYELPWANVSNTPFRLFKHYVHEGGISTPLLVQWPARIPKGGVCHSPCHITDVLATILEAAGTRYPTELGGEALQRPDGESLLPLLEGRPWVRQQPIYWDAARVGNFKLVRKFDQPWELYDMETDRTELHDLSKGNEGMMKELTNDYEGWAQGVGVVDWRVLKPKLLKAWDSLTRRVSTTPGMIGTRNVLRIEPITTCAVFAAQPQTPHIFHPARAVPGRFTRRCARRTHLALTRYGGGDRYRARSGHTARSPIFPLTGRSNRFAPIDRVRRETLQLQSS